MTWEERTDTLKLLNERHVALQEFPYGPNTESWVRLVVGTQLLIADLLMEIAQSDIITHDFTVPLSVHETEYR